MTEISSDICLFEMQIHVSDITLQLSYCVLYLKGGTLEITGGYAGESYTVDARNYYGSDRVTITGKYIQAYLLFKRMLGIGSKDALILNVK